MFDETDYKAAFSKVTASGDTYRRVMNMANKNRKHSSRIVSKGLAAAAMISLLAVTAAATENGWFLTWFSDNAEEPLTTQQVQYVEQNEQSFDESRTHDGFTMELRSAITDGEKAYICLGITAPEDTVLNKTNIEGYSPMKPTLLAGNWSTDFLTNQSGETFFGYSSIASVEDYDGLSNTQNLVIQLSADSHEMGADAFGADAVWKLKFEDLIAKYTNDAYYQELMNGKYKGMENFHFTEEEGKQLYPEVVLAEGVWDFTVRFQEPDVQEAELITSPVAANASVGMNEKGEGVCREVNITSFVLRSLSASLRTDDTTFAPDFAAAGDIFAVMQDGSKVRLVTESGGPGEQEFRAEAPIILSQVDHVLMADGTKLSMPAE